jgi:hypothetical protein
MERGTLLMQDAARFVCRNCAAEYRVVRVEAPPSPIELIACLTCDAPLSPRDGVFLLKYFRVKRGTIPLHFPGRRRRQASAAR